MIKIIFVLILFIIIGCGKDQSGSTLYSTKSNQLSSSESHLFSDIPFEALEYEICQLEVKTDEESIIDCDKKDYLISITDEVTPSVIECKVYEYIEESSLILKCTDGQNFIFDDYKIQETNFNN